MKELKEITFTRGTFKGPEKVTVKIGNDCFIGHCGGFHSVFGEDGKVTKITDRYIYCTSESGSVVRYNIEKRDVCGKWKKDFYFIQFNTRQTYCTPENKTDFIKSRPSVWNSEKCQMEYK
jgi:hypothetical protein